MLIGNKIDMENERQVSHEEASNLAKIYKIKYFETSAKTGFRIDEAFHTLYEDIYNLNKRLENDDADEDKNKNKEYNNDNKGNIELKKEEHIENKKKKKC